MSEERQKARMAVGRAAPRPKPSRTRPTHRRWHRAHTELINFSFAVFQDPMFWLNVLAPLNACEPSRALKEHAPHEPRAPTASPVHGTRSAQSAECVRSEVQALEIRGNCGGWIRENSERASVLSLVHICYFRDE